MNRGTFLGHLKDLLLSALPGWQVSTTLLVERRWGLYPLTKSPGEVLEVAMVASVEPVELFCKKFGISEAVYRACAAAGPLVLAIFLSNYHPRAAEYDAPMPAASNEGSELPVSPTETAVPPQANGLSAWPETRVSRILTCPEAAGRQAAAEFLARNTFLSVQDARKLLASLPVEVPRFPSNGAAALICDAPRQAFPAGSHMARQTHNPWTAVIREVNRQAPSGAITSDQLLARAQ